MKPYKTVLTGLVILLLTFRGCSTLVNAQEISKYDLEQRGTNHFENMRYKKAAEDFEILYTMFPKDARFAYFLGRSYLHSNINIDRAAELLKYAATRNYGDDTYFYLGLAYHHSYKFDDASLAFLTFQKTVSESKQKKYNIDYWIAVNDNARQAVTIAQNLRVENLKNVPAHALESAFAGTYDGKFIYVPEELRSETDRKRNCNYLMYLPDNMENGDYLFFTCQSDKGKEGEDIYWVQQLNGQEYSIPEPLSVIINTPYDDAYPFFKKATNTLYFSSKGHNTSGGYDIFRSVYDTDKNEWSVPEKLDFPINSVVDDFFLCFSAEKGAVTFLTNRNTELHEYEAYTIEYPFTGEYLSTHNRDEIMTYALLSPASITIKEDVVSNKNEKTEVLLADNTEPAIPIASSKETNEYDVLISQALELQSQSDSLASTIKLLRVTAQNEHDYKKKQDLVATLTTLEQESERLQLMANEKFQLAEDLRNLNHTGLITVNEAEKESEPDDAGITLYKYETSQNTQLVKSDNNAEIDFNKGMEAGKKAGAQIKPGFDILSNSPYSEQNPIPLAAAPAGLIYKIQLGAYSGKIPENTFGGLTPLSKENAASSTKYYLGNFISIKEARQALDKVKEYGYPDAFLVSFYNSEKISIQEAREIEFAEK